MVWKTKVGVLEAQQFSTTTKLRGEVNMILGGVNGAQLANGNQCWWCSI
jgi:hypothetical protein